MDELVKIEREFLKENKAEKNNKGVYLYVSANGNERISLDFFLFEYKNWLLSKGHVK